MDMRSQLQAMARETPVVELLNEPPTVRCSALPLLVDAALDLAAGVTPSLAWAVTTDYCVFLSIRGLQSRKAIVISFPSPESDEFIQSLFAHAYFVLDVEGCIPTAIRTWIDAQHVLLAYFQHRGWL